MNSSANNNNNNDRTERDNGSPQQMVLREIAFSFENLKHKIVEKLESFKESAQKQIIDSTKKSVKKTNTTSFNVDALKSFEKVLSKEMEGLRFEIISGGRPFQPTVVNTVEVNANIGFNYGANVYNQKHNMIIACPSNSSVHFHDATDFGAMRQRRRKAIDSSVVQMSYCAETDTHLMGCAFGDVYTYNASANILTKVLKEGESFILGITYITPKTFAFSSSKTGKLYFGNTKTNKAVPHYSLNSDAWYLHNMKEQQLLISGLSNGKVALYNTRKSSYPMIDSVQAHRFGKYVTAINDFKINGKHYVVTGGNDHTIKVWQFVKGKLRLLKSIPTNDDVSTIVYLENYKMIATTHHKDYVNFYSMPFGKLETTLSLGLSKARNIFLMPDKNSLGVADLAKNVIRVVQLHAPLSNTSMDSLIESSQSR